MEPSASAPAIGGHAAGHFLAPKAGMSKVDPVHVAKVVEEASKGSRYYENAMQREQQLKIKIDSMKRAVAATSATTLAAHAAEMDKWAAQAEAERSLSRVCVVVDMDAFFAACEERDDPSLHGTAFAVGGMGMISTASYAARQYGVRSAMPGFIGIKLCPHLRFVKPNFSKYSAASEEARGVFREYDESMHAGSLDEAYLNVTAYATSHRLITQPPGSVPTPDEQQQIAQAIAEMRERVSTTTRGLTCSSGIAPNFMLAKIASNDHKPNGQTLVPFDRDAILEFLKHRSVRAIPGVGKVTEKVLVELGILTIADILTHKARVRAAFNERMSQWLLRCALGVSEHDIYGFGDGGGGSGEQDNELGRKSISHERTFSDCDDRDTLLARCEQLAKSLADEMAEEHINGRTISIRLKLATFEVRQRSVTLPRAVTSAADIAAAASELLKAEFPVCLRLLGVRVSTLGSTEVKTGALDAFVVRGAAAATPAATSMVTAALSQPAPLMRKRGALDAFVVRNRKKAAGADREVIVISDSEDENQTDMNVNVIDCTSDCEDVSERAQDVAAISAPGDAVVDDEVELSAMLSQEINEWMQNEA